MPSTAQPSRWLWARSDSGDIVDGRNQWSKAVGQGSATDSQGNVYAAGYFQALSVTLDNITLTNKGVSGGGDILIVKYNPNGQVVWARNFGGANIDQGNAVIVDGEDNVYVTGQFASATIDFDGTILYNPDLNINIDTHEYFLLKLNSDGDVLWVRSAAGSSVDVGAKLAIDAANNVYVQGMFLSSRLDFGGSSLGGNGQECTFLAKYDKTGQLIWSRALHGQEPTNAGVVGNGIEVSVTGHLYVAGTFFGQQFLAGDKLVQRKAQDVAQRGDIFLIDYDLDGNVNWAKSFGGNDSDVMGGIDTDQSGMVYITGSYISETLLLDNFVLINPPQVYGRDFDIYLAKLNPSGKVMWAQRAYGRDNDIPHDIVADKSGSIFLAGVYYTGFIVGEPETQQINFGNFVITERSMAENLFVVQYDTAGAALWIDHIGMYGWNHAFDVSAGNDGSIFATGVGGRPDVFGDDQMEMQSTFFMAKLQACPHPLKKSNQPVSICEGKTAILTSDSPDGNMWDNGSTSQSVVVNQAGKYSVMVVGDSFCAESITTTVVNVNPLPEVTIEASATSFCPGETVTLSASESASYLWSDSETEQSIEINEPGDYQVSITDVNGCSKSSPAIHIDENTAPLALELNEDCNRLYLSSPMDVTWFRNDVSMAVAQEITPSDSGKYYAETSNICGTSRSNSVYFTPPEQTFVPNLVTPNEDALNDHFVLDKKMTDASVQIFNRWGEEIFSSPTYKNDWPDRDLSPGVYYYLIVHPCFPNALKGPVSILK